MKIITISHSFRGKLFRLVLLNLSQKPGIWYSAPGKSLAGADKSILYPKPKFL